MAVVSLTLGESKSSVSLSLEEKGSGTITWNDADWTGNEAEGTWDSANVSLSKEAKSKVDLSLESK